MTVKIETPSVGMKTMSVADLCQHMDLSVALADQSLTQLQKKGLVTGYVRGDLNAKITLTADARQLLVQSRAAQDLIVTEGVSGTWYYHLSAHDSKAEALCGAATMSTGVPLSSWGSRGHLKERYCSTCAQKGAEVLQAAGVKVEKPIFSIEEIPVQAGARWFLKRGGYIYLKAGFKSKEEASGWIDALGTRLDWRTGFLFRLRGDSADMEIVTRAGVSAKV